MDGIDLIGRVTNEGPLRVTHALEQGMVQNVPRFEPIGIG
jgi:hypothetical protein